MAFWFILNQGNPFCSLTWFENVMKRLALIFYLFAVSVTPATIGVGVLSRLWFELPSTDGLISAQPEIRIEDVPETLKQAIIAAEDECFYKPFLVRMFSLRCSNRQERFIMHLSQNRLIREPAWRLKAYLFTIKITRDLSKDQILESYINTYSLGRRVYGFPAAARVYFGKQLTDLSVAEAAMLASLTRFNSFRAQERQHYVLQRMFEIGFIDEAQYRQSLDEPLQFINGNESEE